MVNHIDDLTYNYDKLKPPIKKMSKFFTEMIKWSGFYIFLIERRRRRGCQ